MFDSATETPILPVYWRDNQMSLLPGKELPCRAKYFLMDSDRDMPVILDRSWNVDKVTFK
jgi:hypothetical protein